MPLIIVKASEVREGEPRWWCDEGAGENDLAFATRFMHVVPNGAHATHAIVDRPGPPAAPTPDPREEAFWSAAFCASLSALDQQRPDDNLARQAGNMAEAALVEWRKRWGAK